MTRTNARFFGQVIAAAVLGLCVAVGPISERRVQAAGQQRASSGALPDTFGFGRPATPEAIAALDIDVMPDGTGLPPGSGTATDGAQTWGRVCRGCHGPEGGGGTAAPLVGDDPSGRPITVGN